MRGEHDPQAYAREQPLQEVQIDVAMDALTPSGTHLTLRCDDTFGQEGSLTLGAVDGGAAPAPAPAPVALTTPSCAPINTFDAGDGPGTVFAITTSAFAENTPPDGGTTVKEGVPVSFSVVFPVGPSAPVAAPAATITDISGNATTVVAVPPGASAEVAVSSSVGLGVFTCDLGATCACHVADGG